MRLSTLVAVSFMLIALITIACAPSDNGGASTGDDTPVSDTEVDAPDTDGTVTETEITGDESAEDPSGAGSQEGDEGDTREETPIAQTPTMGGLIEGWPPEIVIPPDFTVTSSVTHLSGGMGLSAEGMLPAEEVAGFYSEIEGWESHGQTSTGGMGAGQTIVMMRFAKGNAILDIQIVAHEDRTELHLNYQEQAAEN